MTMETKKEIRALTNKHKSLTCKEFSNQNLQARKAFSYSKFFAPLTLLTPKKIRCKIEIPSQKI